MEFTKRENERRSKFRFAIEREIRYKIADDGVVVASGSGHTIDMGSGGIAFAAQELLEPGGFVELSISWPVLLGDTCPMRLIVFGRILRCTGYNAACTVDKYEFRTQARSLRSTAHTRSDGMLQRWSEGIRKESYRVSVAGA